MGSMVYQPCHEFIDDLKEKVLNLTGMNAKEDNEKSILSVHYF